MDKFYLMKSELKPEVRFSKNLSCFSRDARKKEHVYSVLGKYDLS